MKNVLKSIVLLFFLSLVCSCSRKQFVGTYQYVYNGTLASSYYLILEKDQSFEYISSNGMSYSGIVRGFGNYAIKKDSIYLNYLGMPDSIKQVRTKNSLLDLSEIESTQEGISKIKMQVVEDMIGDTIPLFGVNVKVESANGVQGFTLWEDWIEFTVNSEDFPLSLETQFIGFETFEIHFIDGNQDYELRVLLEQPSANSVFWIEGMEKYKIEKKQGAIKIRNMTRKLEARFEP